MAGARTRTPVLENLRRPVIRRDQDVGKRFVVAQQHVKARPQALDQIGFEQQRLGLGAGDDEFECSRGRDHARDAGSRPAGAHKRESVLMFFALPT